MSSRPTRGIDSFGLSALVVVTTLACGDDNAPASSGIPDTGTAIVEADAGDPDANGNRDASAPDGAVADASTVDAASVDAGEVTRPGLVVFDDELRMGATVTALQLPDSPSATVGIDTTSFTEGAASLRIDVPPVSAFPPGATRAAGAVIRLVSPTDLSQYGALMISARASMAVLGLSIRVDRDDSVGFADLRLVRSDWQALTFYFPNPAKATNIHQVTLLVEPVADAGSVYLDDIRFVEVPNPPNASYSFLTEPALPVGQTAQLNPLVQWPESGDAAFDPELFDDLISSRPTVATVSSDGVITAVAAGTTMITGRIGQVSSSPLTISVFEQGGSGGAPAVPATPPTYPASSVDSVFSDAYTNVPSIFEAVSPTSMTAAGQLQLNGDLIRSATVFSFGFNDLGVAAFTLTNPLDTSGRTILSFDVYARFVSLDMEALMATAGPDGVLGTPDDQLVRTLLSNLTPNQWNHLDIPLVSFQGGPIERQSIRSVGIAFDNPILTTSDFTVYIDNVLFR